MTQFFDAEKEKTQTKKREYAQYLKISEVPVTAQILDDHPALLYQHWLKDGNGKNVGVRCLGPENCPICVRNEEVGYNREHPDYHYRQRRYRVNVLDRTQIKECPECGAVYIAGSAPNICSVDGCIGALADSKVRPLNEVKILERGVRLMEKISDAEKTIRGVVGEDEQIQDYPLVFTSSGKGIDTVIEVKTLPKSVVNIEEYEDDLYDLEGEGIVFTVEEINYLLNGGTLNDILTARSSTTEEIDGEDEEIVEDSDSEFPF